MLFSKVLFELLIDKAPGNINSLLFRVTPPGYYNFRRFRRGFGGWSFITRTYQYTVAN